MPTKTTDKGREYDIKKGRYFVWHAEVWEDDGEAPFDITLPLRMKASIIFDIGLEGDIDLRAMKAITDAIAPNQQDAMREMDLNDFMQMFGAWQHEYELLNGASLGESAGSSR